jgi:hypothetical protein
MGFFSWNCKRCGHPMLSEYALEDKNEWMNDVVVIENNGSILKGKYDGYGCVDDREISGMLSKHEPECYHLHCWEKAGSPMEYTSASDNARDQGFFFDDGVHNIDKRLV